MTLSILLNHHAFETVIPFIDKRELKKRNIDLFQLRETYDLLRAYIPQHPAWYPIYAGYFTQKDGQWVSSLKFSVKRLTFEDVARQVVFIPGGSLIPGELIANCLIEYLSQPKPEQIHNAEREPLVVPILHHDTQQSNPTEQARIHRARTELCNEWKDLLSRDQLRSAMQMAHGMVVTFRDLSGSDEPLSYIVQSIQRYTTISPSSYNRVFCRLSHPSALRITPEQQDTLSDALVEWLGHDKLQIMQTLTDNSAIRCQLLLVANESKCRFFGK